MSQIEVKLQRPRVDELLARYETQIGNDFPGYRNHVYRNITFAMHLLNQAPEYEQLVETAFVYHDIGLWTDHELAYLEPSEAVALADNEKYGWGLDPELLRNIIQWHHKITPYKGPNHRVIEACRKADWVDFTMGLTRKGIDKVVIAEVRTIFPNEGFHKTLLRLTKDYGGSTLAGCIKVTKGIVKW